MNDYTIYVRIQEEELTTIFAKGKIKKKWTGWRPKTDEQTQEFRKNVMEKNFDTEDDIATTQKNIETVAGEVAQIISAPENVRLREEAAARCTAKINRKVLKKQARKVRAEHLVKCCLEPGKKKAKKKAADTTVCERAFH